MDYRCLRILKITYKDRITNVEVRNRILRAIGPHKDLLTNGKGINNEVTMVWTCMSQQQFDVESHISRYHK